MPGEKKQKSNGNKKKAPAEKPGEAPLWALVLMSKLSYKTASVFITYFKQC